jgi:hypothetical protein
MRLVKIETFEVKAKKESLFLTTLVVDNPIRNIEHKFYAKRFN